MRLHIPCTAIGLAIVAAAPAANAQTVTTTRQIVERPVETVRTTTTTVRTIAPAHRVVTRRTVVSRRVLPAPAAVRTMRAVATTTYAAAPLYDAVGPAPVEDDSYYSQPVYDTVAPVTEPLFDEAVPAAAPVAVGAAVPAYRYVYQSDRILVIDPATGIAVQALPR